MMKNLKIYSLIVIAGLMCSNHVLRAQELADTLSASSSRIYSGETIEKYPTINLMNSFTGVIPGLFVTEQNGMTGLRYNAENCTLTIRGNGTETYIVDGVLVSQPSEIQLSADEIESISVVSDVLDKLRYGPSIHNGAVRINTVRGIEKGRQIRFSAESGVELIDRFPEWVTGVDYAKLNNLARSNSNQKYGYLMYPENYSKLDIAAFMTEDPLNRTNPNVDWRNTMLQNYRTVTKANFMVRGGGERVRYSGLVSYANNGDIYKFSTNNYNRLNAKMNLNVDVNDWISLEFNFLGGYTARRSPFSSYKGRNTPYELPTLLTLLRTVPSVAYPLYLDVDPETGKKNYAVSEAFPTHPYATFAETGSYMESSRSGLTNAKLNFDLSGLVPGLKSETLIAYNIYYLTIKGQSSDYVAYIYNPLDDTRSATSHLGDSESEQAAYGTGYLQDLQFYEKLYWDYDRDGHKVNLAATYLRRQEAASTSDNYNILQNYIVEAKYNFANRYTLELIGNCAGTSALRRGHRYGFFPAAGFSWIASNEDFLKNAAAVNFLKLRLQAGVIGNPFSDSNQYLWEGAYSKGSAYNFGPYANTPSDWIGGTALSQAIPTTVDRYRNHDLRWSKTYEFSAGVDALFFDRLTLGVTYYDRFLDGGIANVGNLLPSFYGRTTTYANILQNRYYGTELNINWTDKIGDFKYSVGGYLVQRSNILVKGNTTYAYDYMNPEGKSSGSIIGYRCIGKFTSAEDIASSPTHTLDNVQVGDLKYKDINQDGQIDANDREIIGDSTPKLLYAININLAYKGFDLTVVGTGKAFYNTMLTNEYFWNGWGDSNYSTFVRDNIGGRYPRLDYEKSNNNFVISDYWMEKGGFFKIQNVELGYTLNFKQTNKLGVKGMRFHLRGANLLTISRIKDVDPEYIDAGVTQYPLFRTFTAGFNINF